MCCGTSDDVLDLCTGPAALYSLLRSSIFSRLPDIRRADVGPDGPPQNPGESSVVGRVLHLEGRCQTGQTTARRAQPRGAHRWLSKSYICPRDVRSAEPPMSRCRITRGAHRWLSKSYISRGVVRSAEPPMSRCKITRGAHRWLSKSYISGAYVRSPQPPISPEVLRWLVYIWRADVRRAKPPQKERSRVNGLVVT